MKTKILTIKYNPTSWDDVVGLPENLVDLIGDDMPHLLFTGVHGTGKTTCARLIIKQLGASFIELNASNERGIDVIREKVKSFAQTVSANGKFKIIFLDEADLLTKDAQGCLRNIFETYAGNCRFIMTGNYEHKIIPALKSRCVQFTFSRPDRENIAKRLLYICEQEKINISSNMVDILIDKQYPDIRQMINILQQNRHKDIIVLDDVLVSNNAVDIWNALKEKSFPKAREAFLRVPCPDPLGLVKELYNLMMLDPTIQQKGDILLHLSDCQRWLPNVAHKELEIERALLLITRCLK